MHTKVDSLIWPNFELVQDPIVWHKDKYGLFRHKHADLFWDFMLIIYLQVS